jgi:hypothetical protein
MSTLTVGQLRRELSAFDDDDILHLPGNLSFYRIKAWGENEALFQVNEALADLTASFKKQNPQVLCAFIATPENDGQIISGPTNVSLF